METEKSNNFLEHPIDLSRKLGTGTNSADSDEHRTK